MRQLITVGAVLCVLTIAQSDGTIFAVGERDDTYAEFALAQDGVEAFAAAFPGDIVVDGQAPNAADHLPFIQPSDSDHWAGARQHPIQLRFRLPGPAHGVYRLTVDLVACHWGGPPLLVAELGGLSRYASLPPLQGDDEVLDDPSRGQEVVREFWFPAQALREGDNTLTLRAVSGSWVLYDALVFEQMDQPIPSSTDAVFTIGRHDDSYREFALADRGYGTFSQVMPGTVVVDADGVHPERQLPYILPGPTDAWAGSTTHPVELRFTLPQAPASDGCLLLDLVAAHGTAPPELKVEVNGAATSRLLTRGPGDHVLSDPTAGREQLVAVVFPAACLRAGENRIVLRAERGSWMLPDAIDLLLTGRVREAELTNLRLQPRAVRLKGAQGREQPVRLSVNYWGPVVDAQLTAQIGDLTLKRTVSGLGFGRHMTQISLPATDEPQQVKAVLRVGDLQAETTVHLAPARHITLYVCPSIHTDIGYTHVQPECARRHVESLLAIMQACDDTADYPPGSRLKWNCEVAWEAEQLEALAPESAEAFYALCRDRRIGVSAAYCNELTGLMGHEQFCRLAYTAERLRRDHGVPMRFATMTDNPSYVWSLPSVLTGSGVPYFAVGCNDCRGAFAAGNPVRPPAWWEGPDSQWSLFWFGGGYAMATGLGLMDSLQAAEERVPEFAAARLAGKPGCDMALAYGAVGDNQTVSREQAVRLADVVRAWNERYQTPRLVLATFEEFFDAYHRRHGEQAPSVRGDGGAYWEDGAASSARETALNRETHELVCTAEKLNAWASLLDPAHPYPAAEIGAAVRDSMLYDEHTWGAHSSITDPDSAFVRDQWAIKAGFATSAHRKAQVAVSQGLRAVAGRVTGGSAPSVLVYNPLSWERTCIVQIALPDRPVDLVDVEIGTPARQEVVTDGEEQCLAFLARGVPALGYRVYRMEPADKWPTAAEPQRINAPATLDTPAFRLRLSPAAGGITSLVDRRTGRELLDTRKYSLGQCIYDRSSAEPWGAKLEERILASGGQATWSGGAALIGWAQMPLKLPELGPAMLRITWSAAGPELGVELRVDKRRCLQPETVFMAFPFRVPRGRFRYELPLAVAEANADQLPNACRDWYAVQHFVDVSNDSEGVTWATRDAFLAEFADIQTGRWLRELPLSSSTIFANLMNNLWFTNYKADQEGPMIFRFALLPHEGGFRRAEASRFGFEQANPVLTATVPAGQAGTLPGASASLLTLTGPAAAVLTVKAPEAGEGLILRLYDLAGRTAQRTVRLPGPLRRAALCNLVEVDYKSLATEGSQAAVPLQAKGVATVRVVLK